MISGILDSIMLVCMFIQTTAVATIMGTGDRAINADV